MASADELMREAQYAFQNISFGDTPENRKKSARALSLAAKIVRKYPTSPEASVARSIMRHLGDESYAVKFENQHAHAINAENPHAHAYSEARVIPSIEQPRSAQDLGEQLDWQRLIARIFKLPKFALLFFVFAGIFVFGIFGLFLIVPLVMLVVFATPLRAVFPAKNQQAADDAIRRINAWLREHD